MRAYQTIRFIEQPDIMDIRFQGRKTSIGGRLAKGYFRNKEPKHKIRRHMKRRDKQRIWKEIKDAESV